MPGGKNLFSWTGAISERRRDVEFSSVWEGAVSVVRSCGTVVCFSVTELTFLG